jgi:hypothetical protein
VTSTQNINICAGPDAPYGVSAVGYSVTCTNVSATTQTKIGAIAERMDACWGHGVSGFFNYAAGSSMKKVGYSQYELKLKIDPMPAYVAQNLDAYNTTVTGYYTTTWEQTTVARWPSGWTLDSTKVAGQPCSNVDLGAWYTTIKTIQASGSYRRCI